MAAFLSSVPAWDIVLLPTPSVRASLRLVYSRPQSVSPRPVARWHRGADGCLVCHWQPADPDPLPRG